MLHRPRRGHAHMPAEDVGFNTGFWGNRPYTCVQLRNSTLELRASKPRLETYQSSGSSGP